MWRRAWADRAPPSQTRRGCWRCREPVLKLVEDGTLSAGHARALLPLSDPADAARRGENRHRKGACPCAGPEALAAQLTEGYAGKTGQKTPPVSIISANARGISSRCSARKVRMTQGRKTGRIELEYYDADDREALLQALEAIGRRN